MSPRRSPSWPPRSWWTWRISPLVIGCCGPEGEAARGGRGLERRRLLGAGSAPRRSDGGDPPRLLRCEARSWLKRSWMGPSSRGRTSPRRTCAKRLTAADLTGVRAASAASTGRTSRGHAQWRRLLQSLLPEGPLRPRELVEARLPKADLREACLDEADLTGAKLAEPGSRGEPEGHGAGGSRCQPCQLRRGQPHAAPGLSRKVRMAQASFKRVQAANPAGGGASWTRRTSASPSSSARTSAAPRW